MNLLRVKHFPGYPGVARRFSGCSFRSGLWEVPKLSPRQALVKTTLLCGERPGEKGASFCLQDLEWKEAGGLPLTSGGAHPTPPPRDPTAPPCQAHCERAWNEEGQTLATSEGSAMIESQAGQAFQGQDICLGQLNVDERGGWFVGCPD